MPRGGERDGAGRKSAWGENPVTETIRIPTKHKAAIKRFAEDLHRDSQSDGGESLLIWWLRENECKLIGEPYERSFLSEQHHYPYYQYWGFCCIEELPLPDYIKGLYCSRYGRPGRGRLWIPSHVESPTVDLSIAEESVKGYIEQAGGLVFHKKDLAIVRMMPGLITDLQLKVIADLGEGLNLNSE